MEKGTQSRRPAGRIVWFGSLACALFLIAAAPPKKGSSAAPTKKASPAAPTKKGSTEILIDEVLKSPDQGNVALLASRAGRSLDDSLGKVVDALNERKGAEERRKILDSMGLIVDHEKLLKAMEKQFAKSVAGIPVIRDSRYYRVMSTASEGDTKIAQDHMDAIHVKYREIFKFQDKPDEKFMLLIFRNHEEYQELTKLPGSAACYIPHLRALACSIPRDLKSFSSFYHEGFHQFFAYYYPNIPPWLHEGFATYFDAAELKKRDAGGGGRNFDFAMGKANPRYLELIDELVKAGKALPFSRLFALDLAQFQDQEIIHHMSGTSWPVPAVARNYAQSWAAVHFLLHAQSGAHRTFVLAYLKDLRAGRLAAEATRNFFAKVNDQKLTTAWKAYVTKLAAETKPGAESGDE